MIVFVSKRYVHLYLILQIEMGSTNVRVGSSIFGHREKKLSSTDTDTVSEGINNVSVS